MKHIFAIILGLLIFAFCPAAPTKAASPAAPAAPIEAPQVSAPESKHLAAQSRKVDEAVKAARRSLDLQTEIPPPQFKPSPRSKNSPGGFSFAPELMQLLLYLAIAAAVAVIAVILFNALSGYKRKGPQTIQTADEKDEAPGTAALRMEHAQMSADALARAGDFAEAMHILLLQSVTELRRRLGISIADALTSREILERLKISGLGKNALGDIVARVELTHFGGRLPNAEDYLACRSSFETLRESLGGEKAAA